MSLIEKPPRLSEIAQKHPIGGLACGMLVALDILTLEAPVKGPENFSSMLEYQTYIKQLRFFRGFQKTMSENGLPMLQVVGKHLQTTDLDPVTWGVFALRTDTSLGLRGRFDNDTIEASYYIDLMMWRKPLTPSKKPAEIITINGLTGAANPPAVTYQDNYSRFTREPRTVEYDQEALTTYQFDMIHGITTQLEHEARELRYLNGEAA